MKIQLARSVVLSAALVFLLSSCTPKPNIKPKPKRAIKVIAKPIAKKSATKKAVPINYVSNSNLERGK